MRESIEHVCPIPYMRTLRLAGLGSQCHRSRVSKGHLHHWIFPSPESLGTEEAFCLVLTVVGGVQPWHLAGAVAAILDRARQCAWGQATMYYKIRDWKARLLPEPHHLCDMKRCHNGVFFGNGPVWQAWAPAAITERPFGPAWLVPAPCALPGSGEWTFPVSFAATRGPSFWRSWGGTAGTYGQTWLAGKGPSPPKCTRAGTGWAALGTADEARAVPM